MHTHKYAVIGSPVAHSLSPAIHNALYRRYHIKNAVYEAIEITPQTLPEFIHSIPTSGICGFNVTMPLKESVLPFLHHRDKSIVSGANTVVVKSGELYGFSTDAAGFYQSLLLSGMDYTDKNIVFLGCGAVARALIAHAVQMRAKRITLLNRTPQKVQELADGRIVFSDALMQIDQYMPNCDLLINTTPLGMEGTGQEFADLGFLSHLPPHAMVCDLIYHPPQTKLLVAAAQLGHTTMNGLPMLIWQAFYAFRHFFDILPTTADYSAIIKELQ